VSVSRQSEGSAGGGARVWQTSRFEGPGFRDGESGWGGVVLDGDGRQLAVARQWQRTLGIYDVGTGSLIRNLHTSYGPNSVSWLGAGGAELLPGAEGLIAVAEHKCVSLWDLRVGGTAPRSPCVQRLIPTATSPLYSVNWGRGVVGCCGGDRSVYVYDPRRWTIRGRAMGVTKTQAMSLSFSVVDPRIYFVHGADTQLVCGQWDDAGGPSLVDTSTSQGKCSADAELVPLSVSTGGHKGTHIVTGGSLRKVFEFRSVGRWISTHKLQHVDSFMGVCDQQSLYMLPPTQLADLLSYSGNNKRKREEEELDD
jgi:WD40 repeat protein